MTEPRTQNKTEVALEGELELVVRRTFEAPRELVFRAWTEPERIMQWWGPRTWPLAVCTVDLRVGGRWHFCMRGPQGEESWGIAEYKVIEPPTRLVIDDYFSDAQGTMTPPPMTMEVTLEELPGNRTLFVGRSTFVSAEHRQQVVSMGIAEGITESTDQLAEHLERETGRAA